MNVWYQISLWNGFVWSAIFSKYTRIYCCFLQITSSKIVKMDSNVDWSFIEFGMLTVIVMAHHDQMKHDGRQEENLIHAATFDEKKLKRLKSHSKRYESEWCSFAVYMRKPDIFYHLLVFFTLHRIATKFGLNTVGWVNICVHVWSVYSVNERRRYSKRNWQKKKRKSWTRSYFW